jgi:hypothetical protein
VLCKNSNERTLQSFKHEAFVAGSGLIAEHFSRRQCGANFLIIKEAKKSLPHHTSASPPGSSDRLALAAGVTQKWQGGLCALTHRCDTARI